MVCNDTNPSLDRCLWAKYDLKYCCNCLKYYFSTIQKRKKEKKNVNWSIAMVCNDTNPSLDRCL